MDYADLTGPDGTEDNMGGTKQLVYFAPVRDFLSIKKPPASPTTLADKVKITTDHTFNTGKCFQKLYVTLDSGSLDSELQGERDGKSFKNKFKMFYPGSDEEIMGFVAQAKNDRMIYLVPMPDGKVRQVGSEDFHAETLPKFMTGTNGGGRRGYEIEVESMAPNEYLYSGVISLTPAV